MCFSFNALLYITICRNSKTIMRDMFRTGIPGVLDVKLKLNKRIKEKKTKRVSQIYNVN
jgi:hypothetical protein